MNLQDGLNINKYLNVIDTDTVDTNLLKQKVNGSGVGNYVYNTKFTPLDVEANDYFGYKGATMNNTSIIVGSHGEDTTADSAGSLYIFDLSGNQIAKIQASDAQASDNFGSALACNESIFVSGVPDEDTKGTSAGAAYIFDLQGNEIRKIYGSNTAYADWFGAAVSISDTKILIGAYTEDSTAANAGSAYIFDLQGNELRRIQASDPQADDFFGMSVDISNSRIVVGSRFDDSGGSQAGSAYIYNTDGDFIKKIQAFDVTTLDNYGNSVACSDNRIVIGSYKNNNIGAAYIYDINGNFIAKIVAPNPAASLRFGDVVVCDNGKIIVGDELATVDSISTAGAVHIFDINGTFIETILSPTTAASELFGSSITFNKNKLVIGAGGHNSDYSGAAYIFDQKLLPSTTSDIAGTQEEGVTYANIIDEVYNII